MDFSSLNDQEIKALLMQYDSEMRKLNFQMQIIQSTIQKLHESLSPTISEGTQEQALSLSVATKTEHNEALPSANTVKVVEYPKKRTPKVVLESKTNKTGSNILETESIKVPKKRGPKPKNVEKIAAVEQKESKKHQPKPKNSVKKNSSEQKVGKKRGPKPKLKSTESAEGKETSLKRKYTKENPWPNFVINTLTKYGHLMNSAQLYEIAEEENNLQNYGLENKELRAMVSRAFHQLSNNKKLIVKFEIKGSKSYNYGLTSWINESGEVNKQFLP
jgi:hypothetical protein